MFGDEIEWTGMVGTEPDLKAVGVLGGALRPSIDIPPRLCFDGLLLIGFNTQGSGDGVPVHVGVKSLGLVRGLKPRGGALHGFDDIVGSSVGLRDVVDEFAVCSVEVELLAETGLEREWGDALDIVLGDLGGTWGGVLICIGEAGLYASAGSVYLLEGILRGARAFGSGAENGLTSTTSLASPSDEGVVSRSCSSNSGCLFCTIVARGVRLPLPQREDRGLSLGLFRSICLVGGRPGIVAGNVNVSFD